MVDSPNTEDSKIHSIWVDHIPVLWVEPNQRRTPSQLVIWLPGLSGTKEQVLPDLEEFAGQGFVAVGFDPWQSGERGTESREEKASRVFGNFRHHMWPILGNTILDTARVMDWAIRELEVSTNVLMGGISMGGDISVAVAGFDKRVAAVAAVIATPDWLRPGMQHRSNPGTPLPQGEADSYAQFFYDAFNPITHLDSYAHCPTITFECGAVDTHVPPDGALRFQEAAKEIYSKHPERLRVNLHPDIGHSRDGPGMWSNCLEWFERYSD